MRLNRSCCIYASPVVFFVAMCCPFYVNAQNVSCDSKILVTRVASNSAVIGASATAVNMATHQIYGSAFKEDMPYFANLPEGNYQIIVAKPGYQKSSRALYLRCPLANAEVYDWSIELYPGNFRQTVNLAEPPVLATGLPVIKNPKGLRTINGGLLNGKAFRLPMPEYSAQAKALRASGTVIVKAIVDGDGKVIFASAISGDHWLRKPSEAAALTAQFSPTLLGGESVRLSGIITYYFAP